MTDREFVPSEKELSHDENALKDVRGDYDELYGFHDDDVQYKYVSEKGLDENKVREISKMKNEPAWMTEIRVKAYHEFLSRPTPQWGGDLSGIDYDNIYYYMRASDRSERDWDDVPPEIKDTFDKLGIPEAEGKYLQGVSAQYDSESVYHNIRQDLEAKGVIFLDMDSGLREHPEIVKEYFGTVIPSNDNKFSALNTAVWSGGSFIYVPPGVHVEMPLQAYFRINTQNMGQFERTLIIVDKGAYVHYVEGCLPTGEQVSLGDKWVNIEAIRPGDNVLDSNGMMSRVEAVMTRHFKGDLIKVHPLSNENAFQLTPNHPVLGVKREMVRTKRKQHKPNCLPEVDSEKLVKAQPEFIEAGELERGDFIVFPICKVVTDNPQFTSEIMRLLGYYLAEGSAYIHNKLNMPVVCFSFNMNERELIDEVKSLIENFTGKSAMEVTQADRTSTDVRVYSQELYDLCLEHCGKLAAHKQLSKTVMELPPEKQAELIGTYIKDNDSTYERKNTMVRMSTASQMLAWQLQELIARQGHYATISLREGGEDTIQGRTIYRNDQYILYFSPDKDKSEVRKTDDYFLVPIEEIEHIPYDGSVFNFELRSAPNAYLARGFAVHNCTAPTYSSDSLHSAVVEILIKEGGRCRYTTIQNWSNNVYNLVTKRAVCDARATMEWVDGNLGCLAEGSTVTTPDGIKTIESLEAGDEVLSYDETTEQLVFRKVIAKKFSGYQPVHTVSVGKRELQVTANHPFYSYTYNPDAPKKRGPYQLAYVRADQLEEAIIPRTSLDYGKPHKLEMPSLVTEFDSLNQYVSDLVMTRERDSRLLVDEYTTDDLMWMFGYWVGDGDIEIQQGKTEDVIRWARVAFSSPQGDRTHAQRMDTMTALIDVMPEERTDGVHLRWNSKELAEFFFLNGFEGKAKSKRVPTWVCSLPESQRLAFIAGYLDAAAHVSGGRFSIKSVNRELLEDIASVLVTVGITPRLYTEFDEPKTVTIMGMECVAHGSHRVAFPTDERLYPCLSPTLREQAQKQADAAFEMKRTVGRSNVQLSDDLEIVPVEVSEPSLDAVPTWDIEVEGTGNFVSQGFIVHNSRLTMKYPAVILNGEGAHGEVLSIAFAGKGQHQDAGAKITHNAPNTTSQIISKSISQNTGRASYRGLLKIADGADGVRSNVVCDALLLDAESRSDTYPTIEIDAQNITMGHEASVSKIGEDQLFYLMSRGLSEDEANAMIVNGFLEPLVKELPMEYALELNRLIQIQLEGSIG